MCMGMDMGIISGDQGGHSMSMGWTYQTFSTRAVMAWILSLLAGMQQCSKHMKWIPMLQNPYSSKRWQSHWRTCIMVWDSRNSNCKIMYSKNTQPHSAGGLQVNWACRVFSPPSPSVFRPVGRFHFCCLSLLQPNCVLYYLHLKAGWKGGTKLKFTGV